MKRALVLLPLLLLLACDTKQTAATTSVPQASAPMCSLTAKAITAEYQQNEVAADDKYKGKIVEVTGTIGEIGKNAFDQMFVSIKVSPESMDLQAAFEDEKKAELSKLKAGQPVKVQGRVDGFILGSVTMKECKIVG